MKKLSKDPLSIDQKDHETTPLGQTVAYLQDYASRIAGEREPAANSAFSVETAEAEQAVNYQAQFGVAVQVYPHLGSGVAVVGGHGVVQFKSPPGVTPVPGARMMVSLERGSNVAEVLQLTNDIAIDASELFCDSIVQASGVGFYSSPHIHNYIAALGDLGGALLVNSDRPYDELYGDHTLMASTGVGLHVDEEMAFLRVSEVCGIFLRRETGFMRIAGETLGIESDPMLWDMGEYNLEFVDHRQHFMYPWEAAGFVDSTIENPALRRGGAQDLYDGVYAPLDLEDEPPSPIARIDIWSGYVGQGLQEVISAPYPDGTPRGLARRQITPDGAMLHEAVGGWLVAKPFDVPVMRREEHPSVLAEDASYQFSGKYPVGEEPDTHEVESLIAATVADEDYYAYLSQWQGVHVGEYHPHINVHRSSQVQEWTPQWDVNDQVSPPSEEVTVDERYGAISIQQLLSLFGVLPNGDIVFRHGGGAEIRLSGGRVEVNGSSCVVNAARNCSIFSGNTSIRSHNDVELVSSNGAARVSAHTNLLLAGGLGGGGGVLVESRGSGLESDWQDDPAKAVASGIVLKAANSHVTTYGGTIILQTGLRGSGLRSGNVYVDAGGQNLILAGGTVQRHHTAGSYDFFKGSTGSFIGANIFNFNRSIFTGSATFTSRIAVNGDVLSKGDFRSHNGYFYSNLAPQFDFKVKIETNTAAIDAAVAGDVEYRDEQILIATNLFTQLRQEYAGRNRPLNSDAIRRTSFGFGSSESYAAVGKQFRQPAWQRIFTASTKPWNEPIVNYQDRRPTRPYPGNETWTADDSVIIKSRANLIDPATGMPINPTQNRDPYLEVVEQTTETASLEEGFKTI